MEEFKFYEDYDALRALRENPFLEERNRKIREIEESAERSAYEKLNFRIAFSDIESIVNKAIKPSLQGGAVAYECANRENGYSVDSYIALHTKYSGSKSEDDYFIKSCRSKYRCNPSRTYLYLTTHPDYGFANFNEEAYLFLRGNSIDLLKKFLSLEYEIMPNVIGKAWHESKDYKVLFDEVLNNYKQLKTAKEYISSGGDIVYAREERNIAMDVIDHLRNLYAPNPLQKRREYKKAKQNWELIRAVFKKYDEAAYNFHACCYKTLKPILQPCLERIKEIEEEYSTKYSEKCRAASETFIEKYQLDKLKKYMSINVSDYAFEKFVFSTRIGENELSSMSELKEAIDNYVSFKEKETKQYEEDRRNELWQNL